ncbi:MAG: hypothetical protein LBE35_09000 [Clostridiales bacterium]|jgi:hypothetical protein|nr:hypothetical protein [Clostridiales bacterium]
MAIETKMLLKSVLNQIAMSDSLEQAYSLIAEMASVEGLDILSYNDMRTKVKGWAAMNRPDVAKNREE